jgi:hypothetical protein
VTGALALKNGLSPFAHSAFADSNVPTGTPPSPLFGAQKFTQPMPRLSLQTPLTLTAGPSQFDLGEIDASFPAAVNEKHPAKCRSWHNNYNADPTNPLYQTTGAGPCEGRPWGPAATDAFAHQRWLEFFPKVGYISSWTRIGPNAKFHPDLCPILTARLAEVRDKLGDAVGRDILFVSMSVDPEHDTPQVLKAYAEAFEAGAPGWQFVTGLPQDINAINAKFGDRSAGRDPGSQSRARSPRKNTSNQRAAEERTRSGRR